MISKLKDKFSKYGITVRIVILFTVLVVVPFLCTVILLAFVFRNYAVNNIGETTADAMSVLGNQITRSIRQYEDDSMAIYYNGYVEILGKDGDLSDSEKQQVQDYLGVVCSSDTTVHAAYIETEKQTFHGGEDYFRLFELMEPYKQEIIDAGGACKWYPTNQLFGQARENKYILARSLNSKEKKNVGIFYIVLDDEMVKDAFDHMRSKNAAIYLTTKEGQILYSTDEQQFGKTLDMSMINPNRIRSYQNVKQNGESQILIARHMMSIDWYCVSYISMKDTLIDILHLEFPFLVIAVIYILFLLLMLHIMKKYVFRPLRVLKDNMDQYAQGHLESVNMESIGVGEFKSVSDHFNDMTVRISSLMDDYREEVDEKNRQRMKALTSQLTPHFIYNALNTIKWMAVLNHQDNIQHLTESLVHIFMNAARVDDDNYTLQEELNLVSNYAVIQKARFMNFELEIEADEKSKNCFIRKFLLQPIVENAIVHGLGRGKIKNTTIKVKAWVDENLYITVRDEGVGFDVKKWRECPDIDKNHTNIGLHNVEQIIQLEYGNPYRLEIESAPGEGTTMMYILPAVQKGERDDTDDYCG